MTELAIIKNNIGNLTCKELKADITSYLTAFDGVTNSRWQMARAIHHIVTEELFEDDFDNQQEFAKFMGLSKANVTQLVNATNFIISHKITNLEAYSVGKAYVLSTLSTEDYFEYRNWASENDVDVEALSERGTVASIKEWKESLLNVVETEEAEAEEVEAEEVEVKEVWDIEGKLYKIPTDILSKYLV